MSKQLAVVILTYASSLDNPRHKYAVKTLECLKKYLNYSGMIRWHIADDGSDIEHIARLQDICPEASISNAARRGYGASYNLATQILHYSCDYLLMVEDDWELTKRLDIDPLIEALDEGINCIRLGYLGWTQELRGKIIAAANQVFLLLDQDSPEPHVWSGHPRLETVAFQREVGPWVEGISPGEAEFEVANRPAARQGVVWPLDIGICAGQVHGTLFAHIGAVQARTDQIVNV
jgi:hypothetical protein